ncbi:MAG TPA: hypothetical protein PKI24_22010, partial [Nitrospira sp.]|nr:hypothetical protein [Nitrospira sp.]
GVRAVRKADDPKGLRLFRYTPSNGSVTDMGSFGGALCVANGFIRYWRPTPETEGKHFLDQERVRLAGTLEKLVEDDRPLSPPSPRPPFYNELSNCRFPDELAVPEWLKTARKSGRMFAPLKPEHGWAEVAFARRPDGSLDKIGGFHPIRVYPAGNSEQGAPVVGLENVDLSPIWHYSRFKNAYLLEEWVGGTPRTVGLVRSWWLYPDGRVEPALHYDRALRKGDTGWVENKIVPTRAGYLQVHERSYSRLPFANAKTGLYLFRPDGSFDKIAGGRIEWTGLTVSPDGCRVAFGTDERYGEGREQYMLKLIDVCTK